MMTVQSEAANCVLDSAQALKLLGGDRQLYIELIGFYFEDAPLLFAELNAAVEAGKAAEIRMKAHGLKGLVAGCGGVRAVTAAQKVETAGENQDLADIQCLVETLGSELESLTHALHDFSA